MVAQGFGHSRFESHLGVRPKLASEFSPRRGHQSDVGLLQDRALLLDGSGTAVDIDRNLRKLGFDATDELKSGLVVDLAALFPHRIGQGDRTLGVLGHFRESPASRLDRNDVESLTDLRYLKAIVL